MHTYNMGTIKRYLLGLILLAGSVGSVMAQDTIPAEEPEQAPTKSFAKPAFESGYCIANQTVVMPPAKTLEFVIQHDFGSIQDHWKNLWGIWGASNIRLAMSFTVTKDLQIGLGTTKNKLLQDLSVKYCIKRQENGGFPVTVTAFGNVVLNASNKERLGTNKLNADLDYNSIVKDENFRKSIQQQLEVNRHDHGLDYLTLTQAEGLEGSNEADLLALTDKTFKPSYRISNYLELMIARKFNKVFSAQVSLSWAHYNQVDFARETNNHIGVYETNYLPSHQVDNQRSKSDSIVLIANSEGDSLAPIYNHLNSIYNNIGLSFLGRIKVSPQSSILLSYSLPLMTYTTVAPWQNIGIAWEISTSTHAFQIFLTAANGLVPQETLFYNENNPWMGSIVLGFNLTRLWTF